MLTPEDLRMSIDNSLRKSNSRSPRSRCTTSAKINAERQAALATLQTGLYMVSNEHGWSFPGPSADRIFGTPLIHPTSCPPLLNFGLLLQASRALHDSTTTSSDVEISMQQPWPPTKPSRLYEYELVHSELNVSTGDPRRAWMASWLVNLLKSMPSPQDRESDHETDYERLGYRYMASYERNRAKMWKQFNELVWGQLRGGDGDTPVENSAQMSCLLCSQIFKSCYPLRCYTQGDRTQRRKLRKTKTRVRADIQDTSISPSPQATQHVNEARPARQHVSLRASSLRLYLVPQPALPPSPPPITLTKLPDNSAAAITEPPDAEDTVNKAVVVFPIKSLSEQRRQSSMWEAPIRCVVVAQPLWKFRSGLVPGITVTPPSQVVRDDENERGRAPQRQTRFLGVSRR
jgi:hypothetical protein